MSDKLNHFNQRGEAHMVDLGGKQATRRRASAEGSIHMQAETLQRIVAGNNKKVMCWQWRALPASWQLKERLN